MPCYVTSACRLFSRSQELVYVFFRRLETVACPECQQPDMDRAGVRRGFGYRSVDEIMTVAFWMSSVVLLDAFLVLWLKRRLQNIEPLPWW
jgi:hypothetical protein